MLSKQLDDPSERLQTWNLYIQNAWNLLPEATWFQMGLAGLDSGLINKEKLLLPRFAAQGGTDISAAERTDYHTFSILWVLGAYEIVRTIHERLRADTKLSKSKLCDYCADLKKRFERVRIPLAKFDKPNRFPSDSGTAEPGVHFENGAGWFVTPSEFVTRRELSDEFLEMLQNWKSLV